MCKYLNQVIWRLLNPPVQISMAFSPHRTDLVPTILTLDHREWREPSQWLQQARMGLSRCSAASWDGGIEFKIQAKLSENLLNGKGWGLPSWENLFVCLWGHVFGVLSFYPPHRPPGYPVEVTAEQRRIIPKTDWKHHHPSGSWVLKCSGGLFPSVITRQKASCQVSGAVAFRAEVGDGAQHKWCCRGQQGWAEGGRELGCRLQGEELCLEAFTTLRFCLDGGGNEELCSSGSTGSPNREQSCLVSRTAALPVLPEVFNQPKGSLSHKSDPKVAKFIPTVCLGAACVKVWEPCVQVVPDINTILAPSW